MFIILLIIIAVTGEYSGDELPCAGGKTYQNRKSFGRVLEVMKKPEIAIS